MLLLAIGAGLFAAAALGAGQTGGVQAQGGTLRINISDSDVQSLDPAIDYEVFGWQIEAATCAKLLNYPDRSGQGGARLIPEVAAAMPKVSGNGRTYTFTIRPGFRFNTGAPVTAESFAHAIRRALTPRMRSPAGSFVSDIVGSSAVLAGKAKSPSGVRVSGNRLVIRLTDVAPDFLSRIAMPFFCAVPTDLPTTPLAKDAPATAGPYYVSSRDVNRSVVLRRNPFYRGSRPRRVEQIIFTVNTNINQSHLQVRKGDADYDAAGSPPAAYSRLGREFGVNRGRFWVHPANVIIYIALNTSRPTFGDADARKAVNFAVDRRGLLRVAGAYAGTPSDQILPPNIPGFEDARIYPASPDLARARELMAGRTANAVLYAFNDPTSRNQATLVQASLKQIGIDVAVRTFPFAVGVERTGKRGEPFDMNMTGWFADYPDPYDFINVLLDGRRIVAKNNVNTAYFNDPEYNRKMEQASRLVGPRRYRTYGALDIDITRNAAPLAVLYNQNVREFVSKRVGCYSYHPVWASMNLAAVCLKGGG